LDFNTGGHRASVRMFDPGDWDLGEAESSETIEVFHGTVIINGAPVPKGSQIIIPAGVAVRVIAETEVCYKSVFGLHRAFGQLAAQYLGVSEEAAKVLKDMTLQSLVELTGSVPMSMQAVLGAAVFEEVSDELEARGLFFKMAEHEMLLWAPPSS